MKRRIYYQLLAVCFLTVFSLTGCEQNEEIEAKSGDYSKPSLTTGILNMNSTADSLATPLANKFVEEWTSDNKDTTTVTGTTKVIRTCVLYAKESLNSLTRSSVDDIKSEISLMIKQDSTLSPTYRDLLDSYAGGIFDYIYRYEGKTVDAEFYTGLGDLKETLYTKIIMEYNEKESISYSEYSDLCLYVGYMCDVSRQMLEMKDNTTSTTRGFLSLFNPVTWFKGAIKAGTSLFKGDPVPIFLQLGSSSGKGFFYSTLIYVMDETFDYDNPYYSSRTKSMFSGSIIGSALKLGRWYDALQSGNVIKMTKSVYNVLKCAVPADKDENKESSEYIHSSFGFKNVAYRGQGIASSNKKNVLWLTPNGDVVLEKLDSKLKVEETIYWYRNISFTLSGKTYGSPATKIHFYKGNYKNEGYKEGLLMQYLDYTGNKKNMFLLTSEQVGGFFNTLYINDKGEVRPINVSTKI
ncbi:MAG: hypothetical protein LKI39_10030 [Bacteroides sp.]|nr:hypothetical protein [Bacteroides sp.]